MATIGVIGEFNPFHNGHKYLLEEAKRVTKAEHAVTVMSGDFTQRGEPAILSKAARTKQALLNGFDVVIELPFTFACAGARRFAQGAVYILSATGSVTHLAFGSECGDINRIRRVAMFIQMASTFERIKTIMKTGVPFAAARMQAVGEILGQEDASVLTSPNDILAVEYVSAIERLHSDIVPVAIKRMGVCHNSEDPFMGYASASYLREQIAKGDDISAYMPEESIRILNEEIKDGYLRILADRVVLSHLRSLSVANFAQIDDVNEGMENRIYTAATISRTFSEFEELASCKRYTRAHVRRIAMHAFVGIYQDDISDNPQYVRLLGINDAATDLMRRIKDGCATNGISLITKGADNTDMLETEIKAANAAAVFAINLEKCGSDIVKFPYLKKYLILS